ncbi:MATE efflux family protein [Ceratobasidium sp. AG-Ba]|nr:MATE efflux family protein [Ceratobasidium sp. AG-Ba]
MSKTMHTNQNTNERALLIPTGGPETQDQPWTAALKESWVFIRFAAPIVWQVDFVGHLSTEKLAGAALGELTAAVTGLSIILGFVSALDSVLPQAWTSANPSHVGLWTQRMLVLVTLLMIPIISIWLNAEYIFLYLRQEPVVARYAALYLRYLVFLLPFYAFNRVIRRYFQAQGLMHVPGIVVMVVSPINVALNYLLVWGPENIRLGFIGAPIATSISTFLISCLYALYGIFFVSHAAWHPISSRAFTKLPVLFRLGLAGVGHAASEWWAWEFISLIASQFGPTALAAQTILGVSSTTAFMLHAGLGATSAIRIGNLLGAGDARGALLASRVAMALAAIESLFIGLTFMALRHRLVYFFNDDPAVGTLVSGIVPFLALYQVADGIAASISGVLRACGKISACALSSFIGYYILGSHTDSMQICSHVDPGPACLATNAAITYILVWDPEYITLGFIGAPIASSISMTLMLCLYVAYGIVFAPCTAWHPSSSRAFTDMPRIFRLGLAGVGQNAAECGSWEIVSLAASQLTTLAPQTVRTGSLLGAGDAHSALIASRAALIIAMIQSLTLASVFMILRSQLANFFNNDQTVARLIAGAVSLLAIYADAYKPKYLR